MGSKALEGVKGLTRIWVGIYRVVYQIEDGRLVIVVVAVGHRRAVYGR